MSIYNKKVLLIISTALCLALALAASIGAAFVPKGLIITCSFCALLFGIGFGILLPMALKLRNTAPKSNCALESLIFEDSAAETQQDTVAVDRTCGMLSADAVAATNNDNDFSDILAMIEQQNAKAAASSKPVNLFTATELKNAMAKNEFILYYQPKVSLSDGLIFGLEALIRWNHPKRGVLAPNEFLDTIEAFGLSKALDKWVINRACADVRNWIDTMRNPLPVSLNFSEKSIVDSDFIPNLISITQKNNVPHNYIQLELGEDTYYSKTEYCKTLIKILQENDFYVIVENLTIKYCNLENLAAVRCNQFTIDRAVMPEMELNQETKELVRQIIKIAKSNQISVLCEGVETDVHVDLLREIGCSLAKGYYFAKPMAGNDAKEYMV